MRKSKWDIYIFLSLLAILFLLSYIAFIQLPKKEASCSQSPLSYGFSKLEETATAPLTCSCSLLGTGQSPVLRFNSTDVWEVS